LAAVLIDRAKLDQHVGINTISAKRCWASS
jgi:hypothetical protein